MKEVAVKKKKGWFHRELPFHIMLLPAVVITFIFRYIPFAGITMAFEDYTPLKGIFHQNGWDLIIINTCFHCPAFQV